MAMSTTRKVALIIGGIVLFLILVVVLCVALVMSAVRGNRPSIQDNSVLALRISGPLPDYVPDDPVRRIFEEFLEGLVGPRRINHKQPPALVEAGHDGAFHHRRLGGNFNLEAVRNGGEGLGGTGGARINENKRQRSPQDHAEHGSLR